MACSASTSAAAGAGGGGRLTDEGWVLGALGRARVPAPLGRVIAGRTARWGEEPRGLPLVAAVLGAPGGRRRA
jgi:hypothetical protein